MAFRARAVSIPMPDEQPCDEDGFVPANFPGFESASVIESADVIQDLAYLRDRCPLQSEVQWVGHRQVLWFLHVYRDISCTQSHRTWRCRRLEKPYFKSN